MALPRRKQSVCLLLVVDGVGANKYDQSLSVGFQQLNISESTDKDDSEEPTKENSVPTGDDTGSPEEGTLAEEGEELPAADDDDDM